MSILLTVELCLAEISVVHSLLLFSVRFPVVISLPLLGTHTRLQHSYCTTTHSQSDARSIYSGKGRGDHGHSFSSLPIAILPSSATFHHLCICSGRPKAISAYVSLCSFMINFVPEMHAFALVVILFQFALLSVYLAPYQVYYPMQHYPGGDFCHPNNWRRCVLVDFLCS